jgi:hypothetical protein
MDKEGLGKFSGVGKKNWWLTFGDNNLVVRVIVIFFIVIVIFKASSF